MLNVNFLVSLFDLSEVSRKLKVVIDAGNGMAGYTAPAVMAKLNVEVIPMYFELDGNFPNHEANPIEPDNLRIFRKKLKLLRQILDWLLMEMLIVAS